MAPATGISTALRPNKIENNLAQLSQKMGNAQTIQVIFTCPAAIIASHLGLLDIAALSQTCKYIRCEIAANTKRTRAENVLAKQTAALTYRMTADITQVYGEKFICCGLLDVIDVFVPEEILYKIPLRNDKCNGWVQTITPIMKILCHVRDDIITKFALIGIVDEQDEERAVDFYSVVPTSIYDAMDAMCDYIFSFNSIETKLTVLHAAHDFHSDADIERIYAEM